jgi:hypothetical protein
MNPDVVRSIEDLRTRGVLSESQAALPSRVARDEVVSIRAELRAALYAGVLLVTTGAGLLVRQNLEAIGPLGIALGLGLAAAVALGWVARSAPAFSWAEVPSPNLAFDYVLLLGVLLAAADLAYVEARFTPLGRAWPWHLLIVSLLTAACAFRYDSRVVFSLALGTFAAWRGVSVAYLEPAWWRGPEPVIRANMIVCGGIFVTAAWILARSRRKAHFDPVAAHLGWSLVLGALASGVFRRETSTALAHGGALSLVGAILAAWSLKRRRFVTFAMGVVGAYVGLSGLVVRTLGYGSDVVVFFWFTLSAFVLLGALVAGHRTMRRAP